MAHAEPFSHSPQFQTYLLVTVLPAGRVLHQQTQVLKPMKLHLPVTSSVFMKMVQAKMTGSQR